MAILREIEASQRDAAATTWKRQLDIRKWAVEQVLAAKVAMNDDIVPLARKIENYVMGRSTNEGQ